MVFDHGKPIACLPTAPIAGVLLIIALIILSVWPQTYHAIKFDLPYLSPPPDNPASHGMLPVNRILVSHDNEVRWNGDPVGLATLRERLDETRREPIQPGLVFEPDADAGYRLSLQVMAIIARSGLNDELFCFGGIEGYPDFNSSTAASARQGAIPPCDPDLGRQVKRTD